MAGTTFKVAAIFEAFDKMSAPLRNINNRLNQFQKKMKVTQAVTTKSAFGMAGSIRSIATGMIGASLAFAVWDKAIVGTIRRGAELEATLVSAGAKFGKLADVVPGTPQFERFRNAALQAGLTTEFTANQSALAMKNLAAAGLSLDQSIRTLPIVADFATAAGLGIERATEISTKAIGAFGGNIKDLKPDQLRAKMSEINDILVVTANSFSTTVEEIFEASVGGGRVLTRLIGASGFQFASLVGNIAQGGIVAEKAGRGIRAAFLKLTSKEGQKGLRKLGISLTKQNGKFKDIITVISEIRTGLDGVKNEGKRLALGNILFGRVGLVQMDILLGKTEASLRANAKAMKEQSGEVIRIAKLLRATLIGRLKKFNSIMEGLSLIIFNKVAPGLKTIVNFLIKLGNKLAKSSGPLLDLSILFLKITIATKALAFAQLVLNKVLLANPLFALFAILFLLTTIYPDLASKILEFSDVILVMTIAITAARFGLLAYRAATTSAMVAGILWRGALIAQRLALLAMPVIMGIVTAAQWAWNIALTANPIGIIIVAIGGLIAALIALVVFFPEIVEFFVADWFDVLMLLNPFTLFLSILGKIFPDSIGKMLTKVKNMFVGAFSAIGDFLGFGDDEQEIDVNKTSNVNINDDGDITPSPAAAAAAVINGKINVNFTNKPDDVTVSKPDMGSNDDGLVLLSSGA